MKPQFYGAKPDDNSADPPDRRGEPRLALIFNAQVHAGYERFRDVWMIDVSTAGCKLFSRAGLLRTGQQVTIFHWNGEGFSGEVAWTSEMKTGVKLLTTLSERAIDCLVHAPSLPPFKSTRAGEVLLDQFGRELAPLPAPTSRRARP